ncbi:MAG TPA: flagellar biosynthesis protein FlhA [Candidatus Bathyarchaeia archaeon]|nr:flagellar biosynthesis protein FlhA [Candidatus Bathyarchaeia archaeon]
MASTPRPALGSRPSDLLLGGGILGILTVLVLPLPPMLLDFLITLNVTGSLMLLLVSMYVQRPPEFSVFPSLLLVTTLYRLSLNVAATRLILLHGSEGATAAGRVIQGFGQFVVGGNFVVGVVLFLILVVIQFVVITKGAGRIAEVAARFTLDAMPGKQMAIDADLNAGLIGDQEARRRREQISREGDFYGAMDGASKFVRGDAVAAIVITAVNILGGLAIGLLQDGLALDEALATYTILTVGDGLVAQIPALITSTAAGIVVSRAASESDLSEALLSQMTQRARPLAVAAGVLAVLALMPGMPLLPFIIPAALLGTLAYRLHAATTAAPSDAGERPAAPGPEKVDDLLPLDPLQIELGYGLLPLVDDKGEDGGDLLARIRGLRRQFATELGFVVPPVRVRDSAGLGGNQYVFRLHGAEIARGEVFPDRLLAMNPGPVDGPVEGLEVREPTFGLPARWIPRSAKDLALDAGYTVVNASTVIATHLSETVKRQAAALLGRQEAQALLDKVKETHPSVVEGLVPTVLPLAVVHRVLQRLLAEGVSIRNLPAILEVLGDVGAATRDAALLAEHVRPALADTVCRPYLGGDGGLRALLLSPSTEQQLRVGITEMGAEESIAPRDGQSLLDGIARAIESSPPFDAKPVLLCAGPLRRHVRRVTERALPHLGVLSFAELPPHVNVQTLGTVELSHAPQMV